LLRTHEYGIDEELAFVDQPGLERVRCEVRASTVSSLEAEPFVSRTKSGSNLRSSRVLAVDEASKVVE
jgi:hypothetical protein